MDKIIFSDWSVGEFLLFVYLCLVALFIWFINIRRFWRNNPFKNREDLSPKQEDEYAQNNDANNNPEPNSVIYENSDNRRNDNKDDKRDV